MAAEFGDDLGRIETIIADLAAKQARLSAYVDELLDEGEATPTEVARLLALHGQNAARLGRLLRDRQALGGGSLDDLQDLVNRALDMAGPHLGLEL